MVVFKYLLDHSRIHIGNYLCLIEGKIDCLIKNSNNASQSNNFKTCMRSFFFKLSLSNFQSNQFNAFYYLSFWSKGQLKKLLLSFPRGLFPELWMKQLEYKLQIILWHKICCRGRNWRWNEPQIGLKCLGWKYV